VSDTLGAKRWVSDTLWRGTLGVRHPLTQNAGCQTPLARNAGCQTPFGAECWVSDTLWRGMLGVRHPLARNAGRQTPFDAKRRVSDTLGAERWVSDTLWRGMLGVRHPLARNAGCQTPFGAECWVSDTLWRGMLGVRHPLARNAGCQTPFGAEYWVSDTQRFASRVDSLLPRQPREFLPPRVGTAEDTAMASASPTVKSALNAVGVAGDSPSVTLDSAWDEYLLWLSFAVPGMLNRGNVDAMAYALARLPNDAPMLEIGSFCGLSTCVLAYLRQRHHVTNRFFTCDRWSFEGQQLGARLGNSKTVSHDDYRAFVRASFVRNAHTFCSTDLPHTIEADSDGFFGAWEKREQRADVFNRTVTLGGPLSFCYIDGNHTYEFAARDFANTDKWLVPGGFILFDDSADGSRWEVCRVIEEIVDSRRYRVVAKAPNYLVQKLS